jgi:protein-tyrosine-phosphatase
MRKILIRAPEQVANRIEEKLRYRYDVAVEVLPNAADNLCEIKAKIRRKWVTICRFVSQENLKDIITMFEINYELESR